MASTMQVSADYGTHLPCLIKAISKTTGDVLEMGMGLFSTPFLHYACTISQRNLVSYETDKGWAKWFIKYHYANQYHKIIGLDSYDDAEIEKEWDVALIDNSPDFRRVIEVRRLANLTKYIIIHDSKGRYEKQYHFSEIYPLFKYKTDWVQESRGATVLSNLVNLKDFWQ